MPDPARKLPLWERLKHARVGRALLVYLGAAWVILQITETADPGLASVEEARAAVARLGG